MGSRVCVLLTPSRFRWGSKAITNARQRQSIDNVPGKCHITYWQKPCCEPTLTPPCSLTLRPSTGNSNRSGLRDFGHPGGEAYRESETVCSHSQILRTSWAVRAYCIILLFADPLVSQSAVRIYIRKLGHSESLAKTLEQFVDYLLFSLFPYLPKIGPRINSHVAPLSPSIEEWSLYVTFYYLSILCSTHQRA